MHEVHFYFIVSPQDSYEIKKIREDYLLGFYEAQTGFEPVNQGVADPRLTTWLLRLSDSYGNRTRVTAVKGRCLDRLTKEPCLVTY